MNSKTYETCKNCGKILKQYCNCGSSSDGEHQCIDVVCDKKVITLFDYELKFAETGVLG